MKRPLVTLFKRLALVMLLVLSFFTGVFARQAGWMSGLRPALADDAGAELSIFWEAWQIIEQRFVDREALDGTRLSYAALNGLVEALGDTGHTRFLTPEQARQHESSLDGRFFGIGARLGFDYAGRPIILEPFFGSPAEQAGLKAGDRLLAVDGEDVTSLAIDQIVNLIRGQEGTTVIITVLPRGRTQPQEVEVTRGEIAIPSLSWTFIPNSSSNSKIAFIRLSQFGASVSQELSQALTEAQKRGSTGLIVDVRENPGGLLRQAIEVSSQFLQEGNVMQETDAAGNVQTFTVTEGGLALDIPLVVLIDRGSASSSEIFAGAVQDHQRGYLVGEVTFGTGTVLTPYTLSDGSVLLLGTSEWLTADGRSIRKRGITPDVLVELPPEAAILSPNVVRQMTEEELFHSGDAQLLEAIKLLNNCWDQGQCEEVQGIELQIGR
jgi:carboxyl-terminal processing protease